MTLWHKIIIFYLVIGLFCALIAWALSREKRGIRLLAAALIGATWPISFPVLLVMALL